MKVVTTREELRAARAGRRNVAVVMTMGALHDGHAALLRAARAEADTVLMTIFVNPLQFGPSEDLERYPRTLDSDLELARAAGVDLTFTPAREVMYPNGVPAVRVDPGPAGGLPRAPSPAGRDPPVPLVGFWGRSPPRWERRRRRPARPAARRDPHPTCAGSG